MKIEDLYSINLQVSITDLSIIIVKVQIRDCAAIYKWWGYAWFCTHHWCLDKKLNVFGQINGGATAPPSPPRSMQMNTFFPFFLIIALKYYHFNITKTV